MAVIYSSGQNKAIGMLTLSNSCHDEQVTLGNETLFRVNLIGMTCQEELAIIIVVKKWKTKSLAC